MAQIYWYFLLEITKLQKQEVEEEEGKVEITNGTCEQVGCIMSWIIRLPLSFTHWPFTTTCPQNKKKNLTKKRNFNQQETITTIYGTNLSISWWAYPTRATSLSRWALAFSELTQFTFDGPNGFNNKKEKKNISKTPGQWVRLFRSTLPTGCSILRYKYPQIDQ